MNKDIVIADHVCTVLRRELATCIAELEAFPSGDLIWETPAGITNSAGTLALHLAGNLRHYIGHVLGGTDYVRDRVAEFESRGVSVERMIAELELTRREVGDILPSLTPSVLATTYPDLSVDISTGLFLLQLATHAAFHVGQLGYLRRILSASSVSTGGISLRALGS